MGSSRTTPVRIGYALLPPALVVAFAILNQLLVLGVPGIAELASWGAMVCAPLWLSGVVAAVMHLNREDDAALLWIAALYPVLAVVYMRL